MIALLLFLFLLVVSFVILSFLMLGENIARHKPGSSFEKWWRANVIGDDIYNEKD